MEENIVPGKIIYLHVAFPHEDKYRDKYFVVVGIGESPLLLKINTSDQQTEMGKKFNEFQFKIKKSVYTFLDHDSLVDCGTVWILLKTDDVVKQLTEDPKRMKGAILEDHKNEIIRLTTKSKSISPKHKRIIEELRKK